MALIRTDSAIRRWYWSAGLTPAREEGSSPDADVLFPPAQSRSHHRHRRNEPADIDAARDHAVAVAGELKFKNNKMMGKDWSEWLMAVHDHDGLELLSFEMSDVSNGDGN